MTAHYTFTIPGPMRGKQRPRSTRQGRIYTPAETVNAEAWVRQCAVAACGQPVLPGPVELHMYVRIPVPASWSKKKRAAALAWELFPTGKPDLDNVAKLLADALNGILWRDDSQIVRMVLSKRYGVEAETSVQVREAFP